MSERTPKPEAFAALDSMMGEGGRLTVYPVYDDTWPVNGNGWRATITWPNGNRVGASMPTYAGALELLAGCWSESQ